MAQYEPSADQIKELENNKDLTEATRAAIQQIVNDAGAAGVAAVNGDVSAADISAAAGVVVADSATVKDDLNLSQNVSVLLMNETKGTGDGTDINMNTNDAVNVQLTQVEKINLNVNNNANNELTLSNSTDVSVETGSGNDTFYMQGKDLKVDVASGGGDDEFVMDENAQAKAEVSVDAGDGFDLLKLFGKVIQHKITYDSTTHQFKMQSAGVTMDGVEVVATDLNGDNKITDADHITILADNNQESLAAKLYKVALGREAIDDTTDTLAGIKFWMEQDTDPSFDHFGRAFLNCDEFHAKYDDMSDKEYVDTLFANLGANDADTQADLLGKLENGTLDRYEVAIAIAESNLAVKLLGNDGAKYVIDSDNVDFSA